VQAGAITIPLTSDDYVHLVEDSRAPWHYSSDQLFRPLRNGLFKLLAHTFGIAPEPYRIFAGGFYAIDVYLLFRLGLGLGMTLPGAVCAAIAFAFYPRNHAVLFWFACSQDLVVVACCLAACLSWLKFHQTSKWSFYLATILSCAVALGFKETAVAIPALVIVFALLLEKPRTFAELRRFAALISPLVLLVGGFGLYVNTTSVRAIGDTSRVYGLYGVQGALSAGLRTMFNLVSPFQPGFALREVHGLKAFGIALSLASLGIAALVLRRDWRLTFAIVWIFVAILPTALFARTVNADHYLLLPLAGLSMIVGLFTDRLVSKVSWSGVCVLGIICLYILAGTRQIAHYRESWRAAGQTIATVLDATETVLPPSSIASNARIRFINVPHDDQGVGILNNGLKGVLEHAHYPSTIEVDASFSEDQSAEHTAMINSLQACPTRTAAPQDKTSYVLIIDHKVARNVSGDCADALTERDLASRPWAWQITR
jgi:hypothetical protein